MYQTKSFQINIRGGSHICHNKSTNQYWATELYFMEIFAVSHMTFRRGNVSCYRVFHIFASFHFQCDFFPYHTVSSSHCFLYVGYSQYSYNIFAYFLIFQFLKFQLEQTYLRWNVYCIFSIPRTYKNKYIFPLNHFHNCFFNKFEINRKCFAGMENHYLHKGN